MSQTIWKYTLKTQHQAIAMPKCARILTVDEQHRNICVWALVDPLAETEKRYFWVAETGSSVPEGLEYIGTVKMFNGSYVVHVFEEEQICDEIKELFACKEKQVVK